MAKKDDIMFDKREELTKDHPFLRTEPGQYAFQLGFDAAAESIVDKAWDWILRYFMTGPLEFQKEMEKGFRKEMEE